MKLTIIISSIIIVAAFLIPIYYEVYAQEQEQEDFETYTNEDYGFSIDYPEDWEVREYDLQPIEVVNFVTTYEIGDPAMVQVFILDMKTQSANTNATLKELVDNGIESQKATSKQISRTNITIAGLPAEEKILYQYDYGSVKALEAVTLTHDKELIAIHYLTEPQFFDDYLPTARQMVESFKLLNSYQYIVL